MWVSSFGEDLSGLHMNLQHEIETYWQDEGDWLCTIEFLLAMIPKADCLAQTSSVISLATHN